jgi:hypothetical protein
MPIDINRRRTTAAVIATVVAPGIILATKDSGAIVPFLLRLVLQGAFRSTATRTIATTSTRTLASGAVRTATTQFQTVASLGMTATGVATVSTAIWALADKHRAEQIWVAGTEVVNKFVLSTAKEVSEVDRFFYGYRVVDIATGNVEASSTRVGYPLPGTQPLHLPFDVKPLPNSGLKQVIAFITSDEQGQVPHLRFHPPAPKLVVVANLDEVTLV